MSNMYDWTSGSKGKTVNPLAGKCPHECSYCYVSEMCNKFPGIKNKYSGKMRVDLKVLSKPPGSWGTVFVCSMNDLFAGGVEKEDIDSILEWCKKNPNNTYLLQSKNPRRMYHFMVLSECPPNCIFGTTIETNRIIDGISKAPTIPNRFIGIKDIKEAGGKTMISIEPILDFDLSEMVTIVKRSKPDFVSIGADSKKHGLIEPTPDKLKMLISELQQITEVRLKSNLKRILDVE